MEKNIETTNTELSEAEVNIYGGPGDDCGQNRLACHTDCIIVGTSWLNEGL